MEVFYDVARKRFFELRRICNHLFLLMAVTGLLAGCMARVNIPVVKQVQMAAGPRQDAIDAGANANMLLDNLYQLIKANEGIEITVCTAAKDSRRCISDGFSVFVWGGIIPGVGTRTAYTFSEIERKHDQLEFTKDNHRTAFIGTPMLTRPNKCRVYVTDGGLQVQMDNYYANWAGVGNMMMAEGWAIDYLDFNHGIVGLQLELDVKGIFTAGGGSRYVLLKFPKIPDLISPPGTQSNNSDPKQSRKQRGPSGS